MNELETEIRRLSLRTPSDALDSRVLATLQAPASALGRVEEAPKGASAGELSSTSLLPNRKGVVVTSGWIVACASMLTGILIGQLMPPLVPYGGDQRLAAASSEFSGNSFALDKNGSGSEFESTASDGNAVVPGIEDPSIGSQIVESLRHSPAAAVAVWEQQTGQIFNVATHIGDRRFRLCRDCHRVGG